MTVTVRILPLGTYVHVCQACVVNNVDMLHMGRCFPVTGLHHWCEIPLVRQQTKHHSHTGNLPRVRRVHYCFVIVLYLLLSLCQQQLSVPQCDIHSSFTLSSETSGGWYPTWQISIPTWLSVSVVGLISPEVMTYQLNLCINKCILVYVDSYLHIFPKI